MRTPLSLIPLLPVTLLFVLGIVTAHFLSSVWWTGIPLAIAGLLWIRRLHYGTILAVAFAAGGINMSVHSQDDLPTDPTVRTYRGMVTYCKESENSTILYLDLHSYGNIAGDSAVRVSSKAVVVLPSHDHTLRCGDEIAFRASWRKIMPRTDLPDELDPADGYMRHGLRYTSVVKPDDLISAQPSVRLKGRLLRLRDTISDLIFRSSLSGEAKEFINTALTGNSTTFPGDTREIFSKAGLAHILALSGLHVGIISLVAAILLWPLFVARYRKLHTLLTILLLWTYALVTGLSPSVTRAVIMATVFLTAFLLQRRYSTWNALCLAALVILLLDPESLFSIGFQLSFAAVTGILLFADSLNPVSRRHYVWHAAVGGLTISLAAMLGTAVMSAYYFHSLPVYFTLSNILVALLLPFLLGGSILLIIIETMGYDPRWLCDLISWVYDFMETIASFISGLPLSTIDNLYFPAWLMIPATFCILTLWLFIRYRRQTYYLATLALVTITAGLCFLIPKEDTGTALYIGRHTYRTDILIRVDHKLYLATTAPHNEWESVTDESRFRYRDFMNRRQIDSITSMPFRFQDNLFARNGRLYTVGNRLLCVIHSDSMLRPSPARPDFVLVARGFTGSISKVSEVIPTDTILLGADLHPWRHERYAKECRRLGQPFISLREQPFSIVLRSSR